MWDTSSTKREWFQSSSSDIPSVLHGGELEHSRSFLPDRELFVSLNTFFDHNVYAYCIHDFASIVDMSRDVGCSDIRAHPSHYLMNPATLIHRPDAMKRKLGPGRTLELIHVLEALTGFMEERVVARSEFHDLETHLRSWAMCYAVQHPFTQHIPEALHRLLHHGALDDCLAIPGDEYQDRAVLLHQMMLRTAMDFGSPDLIGLSLSVAHTCHTTIDFQLSKQMGYALAKVDRRLIDWSLKSSGIQRIRLRSGWT